MPRQLSTDLLFADLASASLQDTVILIEDQGSLVANEEAKKLSKKLGLQLHTIPLGAKKKSKFVDASWHLVFTKKGLALRLASEPSWSDILVDFSSANLHYRKTKGGGRNEAIAKAIGIKGKESINVLDATAGMGVDSFVMASVGAKVLMLERSQIISALLDNALLRASADNIAICENMSLLQVDAIDYLQTNNAVDLQIDTVYLDPMFPHKKKSALVKKEMRAFQLLLGADTDSDHLFAAAVNYRPKRIVVKRPANAPYLKSATVNKPTMEISSKKHRFDVYLLT